MKQDGEDEALNSHTVKETKSLIFNSKTLTFSLAPSSSRTSNASAPVIDLPVITGKKTLPKALQPRTVNRGASSVGYKPVFSGFPGLGTYPKNPTQSSSSSSSSSHPLRRSSMSTYNSYATPQCNFSRPSTARCSSTISGKPLDEADSIKENESSCQNSQHASADRLIEAQKSRTLESRPVINRRHSAMQRSSIDSESIFNRISGAFERKTALQEEKSSEEAIFRNLGRLAKRNSMKTSEISVDQDDRQKTFISLNPSERQNAKPHSGPVDSTNLDFSWSTNFGENNKISHEPNLSKPKENESSFSVSSEVSTGRSKDENILTHQIESADKQLSQAVLLNDFFNEACLEASTDIREIDPRPEEIMIVQRRKLEVVYVDVSTFDGNRSVPSVHDKWDDDCIPVSPRHTLKSPTNKFSPLQDEHTAALKTQPATPPPSPTTTQSSSSPPPPVTTADGKAFQPNGESTFEIINEDVFKKNEVDRLHQASLSCSNEEEICEPGDSLSPPPPLPSSCPPSLSHENFENMPTTGEEEIHGKVSSVSSVRNSKAHQQSFSKSDNAEDFLIRKFTGTGLESFIYKEKIEELGDETLTLLDLSSHPRGQNFGSEDSGCDQSSVCDNNHSLDDPTSYQEVHVGSSQNGSAEVHEMKSTEENEEEECSQFESIISSKKNSSKIQDISSPTETSSESADDKERLDEATTAADNSDVEVNRSNLVGESDVIEINKGFLGVGFCIEGGVGSPTGDKPILIKRVVRVDVPLNAGDELLSLNGESVSTMTCSQVWRKLKSLPDGIMTLELKKKRMSQ